MSDMNEKASELSPDLRQKIDEVLMKEGDRAFDEIFKLDANLTNNNFLVNAGGAAATLAFMGAKTGAVAAALWPLLFFTVGLIATGLEIRALLYYFGERHNDAVTRRQGFATNRLTVRECSPTKETGKFYARLNHWSGWVSQACFMVGSALGLIGLLKYLGQ
jgi:hypothetical protein